ncbi:MAG: hypothetical protein ABSG31_18300 [Tepidisphaeraceae bacterium]|jgi:hypothetical protein
MTRLLWAEQYLEFKAQYPHHILLIWLADFYQALFDDADRLASISPIASERRREIEGIPTAAIPRSLLDQEMAKIAAAGHHVAICEQFDAQNAVGGHRPIWILTRLLEPMTPIRAPVIFRTATGQELFTIQFQINDPDFVDDILQRIGDLMPEGYQCVPGEGAGR